LRASLVSAAEQWLWSNLQARLRAEPLRWLFPAPCRFPRIGRVS
jgi:hypothetical protein